MDILKKNEDWKEIRELSNYIETRLKKGNLP